MRDETIKGLTSCAYHNTGIVIMLAGVLYFIFFDIIKIVPQSTIFSHIIPIWLTIIGVICTLATKFDNLQKPSNYLMIIAIFALSCDPHIAVRVSIVIPVIISLYHMDRRHTQCIFVTMLVLIGLSDVIRCAHLESFYANDLVPGTIGIIRGSISGFFAFICEVSITVSLYWPYQAYILRIGKERTELLVEKDDAMEHALKFCTTAMEYHSKYLLIHNKSVERITTLLLVELATREKYKKYLTPQKCKDILFSVQFHDIGKIYIDAEILDKPGSLTEEEYKIIKQHPSKGLDLFNTLPKSLTTPQFRDTCSKVIIEHHERLDGRGYPSGKKDISFEGQIIAVADVTDALLSWRCYKKPFSWDRFVETLTSDAGLNQEFCQILINKKSDLVDIIDSNNLQLKNLFKLSIGDIIRH